LDHLIPNGLRGGLHLRRSAAAKLQHDFSDCQ
jgi:hypothetical protein